jgi:FkbH-like protein
MAQLRDLFGKPNLTDEDRFRAASLQASHQLNSGSRYTSSDFVRQIEAELTLDYRIDFEDIRAFDLVNKTNQFNLNGRRFTQSEWRAHLERPGSFMVTVSYKDRFGPLGKIAVLAGRQKKKTLEVSVWVMSCRAFSRFVEYHVLDRLCTHFAVDAFEFKYERTERNGPLQQFLGNFAKLPSVTGELNLTRDTFAQVCAALPHLVHEVMDDRHEVVN